jgi:hypothetical protein
MDVKKCLSQYIGHTGVADLSIPELGETMSLLAPAQDASFSDGVYHESFYSQGDADKVAQIKSKTASGHPLSVSFSLQYISHTGVADTLKVDGIWDESGVKLSSEGKMEGSASLIPVSFLVIFVG